jgi:hypothetical protein
LQIGNRPPHFELVTNGGIERVDIGKGRSNLFKTILLFLQHCVLHCDARLGLVELGSAGLNVLWILNDKQKML